MAGCLEVMTLWPSTVIHCHRGIRTTHLPLAWPMEARRALLRVGNLHALINARLEDMDITCGLAFSPCCLP